MPPVLSFICLLPSNKKIRGNKPVQGVKTWAVEKGVIVFVVQNG
jgi:hypothetical protein